MLSGAVSWAGEVVGGAMLVLLVACALVPYRRVASRAVRLGFVALFAASVVAPTYLGLAGVKGYLGHAPFYDWRLVETPFSLKNMRARWPSGLSYVTLAYRDASGTTRERLLLDDLNEPINVVGMSWTLARRIPSLKRPEARLALAGFLFDFLERKLEYFERTGDLRISRRILGPLSYPTINVYRGPEQGFDPSELVALRFWRVPWGPDEDFAYRPDEIEWFREPTKQLLVEYVRRPGSDVVVERYRRGVDPDG